MVTPLALGSQAPPFRVPTVERAGHVSLGDFHGRAGLFLLLMRGLQCPFCRRNLLRLGPTAERLHALGVDTLAVVATTLERARLRARQFREGFLVCAQYLIDRDGIVRWRHVAGEEGGLVAAGQLPTEEEVLRAAHGLA